MPGDFRSGDNASLTGEITDSNGAVLPGARLQVQNTATNTIQTAETNASGVYLVAPSTPVPTRSRGKAGLRQVGPNRHYLDGWTGCHPQYHPESGDVKEVVTVTADAELINTTTAEIGTTVGQQAVQELPLNGRNPPIWFC